jgi:hypothetical protein
MEIKTTIKIIEENSEHYEDICERFPIVEDYKGEFEETIFKKWVAVDDLLNEITSQGAQEKSLFDFYDYLNKLNSQINKR